MTTVVKYTKGPWTFKWHGGRLADIFHAEYVHAIDCVSVGTMDDHGTQIEPFTRATLKESADQWVKESSADYVRELPYLR